jgi:2-polyprenyl-3-methyl-5-hydroxy-6-metoxy-1,4-benzoquinol methylase
MPFRSLRARDRQPELMDDPGIDPAVHERALRGLARLNRASGIVPTIERALLTHCGPEPLSILDVAAGSGDLVAALAERAKRADRAWSFAACDISETACRAIRERALAAGHEIPVTRADAISDGPPRGHDIVMCHLFLHHLDEHQIVSLLASMREAARRGVLVTDLSRTPLGYCLAWLASRTLTRSPIVHTDALLSVRGALRPEELAELASNAGLVPARIRTAWPERMVMWCDA